MKDRRKAITNGRRMADVIDDSGILGGRTPSTIAAVAVHSTKLETGDAGWDKVEVARAAHLAPSTLSKAIGIYDEESGAQSVQPEF
jgi:hypothetical protein